MVMLRAYQIIPIVMMIVFVAGFADYAESSSKERILISEINDNEGIFQYVRRKGNGAFNHVRYQQIAGAANEFKEGDVIAGVAAADSQTRLLARKLLANTAIRELHETPLFKDEQQALIWNDIDYSVLPDVAKRAGSKRISRSSRKSGGDRRAGTGRLPHRRIAFCSEWQ